MVEDLFTEGGARQDFVDQIHALAEHARSHGPAKDCEGQMATIGAKHRTAIEGLRRRDAEPETDRPAPSLSL